MRLTAESIICSICAFNHSFVTVNGGNAIYKSEFDTGTGGAGGGGRIVVSLLFLIY